MEQKIIKHLVTTYVNKKFRNPEKQRKFLIDCIQSNGYIIEKEFESTQETQESFEDLYQHIISQNDQSDQHSNYFPDFKLSIQEQSQTSVDPYGFNRTFIHADSYAGDKLNLLQQRGITYEETKFNQTKQEMEMVINRVLNIQPDINPNPILQTALNMYLNILIAYKDNPFGFTEIKGSLKHGYIFLCLYYSFKFHYPINTEILLSFSEKTRLKDIPLADKNIKMIFNGVKGYSFIFLEPGIIKILNQFKTLNIDPKQFVSKIQNIIENFEKINLINLYAIVYFVCNDYYPFKVKINFNGNETKVTYPILNEMIGHFSSATIRKITDRLKSMFKNNV